MKKRLVIYFHYDPRGQADEACRFAVRAVLGQAQAVFFVTNGRLDAESRAWAQSAGVRLLERENAGFDVGAYQAALNCLGRAALDAYDEIVLMNYTLAGPVRPLGAMFAAMDARAGLDFWGLSRHYAMRSRRFGGRRGTVPEHLQSHFIAVRRPMYDAFWQYWQAMEPPQSYEDSVAGHETRFTAHFAALGFRWDSFLDGERWRGVFVNPLMACPQQLIAAEGCPFFKRRSFFTPWADELRRTDGLAARRLYDWLKAEGTYPVDALLRALLPAQPLADLARNLHWHFLLPAAGAGQAVEPLTPQQLAGGAALDAQKFYFLPLPLPETQPARYYAQAAVWDAAQRQAAAALLDRQPLLGIVGPALPLYPGCVQGRLRRWRREAPAVRAAAQALGLNVPLTADAPPLPCGCAVVRGAAFPHGLPPLRTPADAWLLPLAAQQQGWGAATAEDAAQALARADLQPVLQLALSWPQAAKSCVRAAKHALLAKEDTE